MAKKDMTEAQDRKLDKSKGIKEGSKADVRMDRKYGVKMPPKGAKGVTKAERHPR